MQLSQLIPQVVYKLGGSGHGNSRLTFIALRTPCHPVRSSEVAVPYLMPSSLSAVHRIPGSCQYHHCGESRSKRSIQQ